MNIGRIIEINANLKKCFTKKKEKTAFKTYIIMTYQYR